MGLDRKLSLPEIVGEGFVDIPFGCTINGTTHPDGLIGKTILTVTREEAGEFLFTLAPNTTPYRCFIGVAAVSNTADDVDMYATVDWSTVASAGTFVVRTMTGATQTDPTNDLLLGGFLRCVKTDRT